MTNLVVFEFDQEWGEDERLDESGYRGIIRLGGVEIGRTPGLLWDKEAAIEAAQDHLVDRLKGLLA